MMFISQRCLWLNADVAKQQQQNDEDNEEK